LDTINGWLSWGVEGVLGGVAEARTMGSPPYSLASLEAGEEPIVLGFG